MNTPLVLHFTPLRFSFATRFPLFRFGVTITIPRTLSIPAKAGQTQTIVHCILIK